MKQRKRFAVAESRIAAGAPFGRNSPETTTFVSITTLSILQFLVTLAAVALNLPVYLSHCYPVEAFGFGLSSNFLDYGEGFRKISQVLFDAHDDHLWLASFSDNKSFPVLASTF
ncbi:MAG: hypothetical protein WCA40_19325 [Candidatus Acidiferrum sp.]